MSGRWITRLIVLTLLLAVDGEIPALGASADAGVATEATARRKFWTSGRRGQEPNKVIDANLGVELVLPDGFGQGRSERSESGPRRVFSDSEPSHSVRFTFVVARLARRADYWTSVVRSCGLSSPEMLYSQPPLNLQLFSIPGSPESGGRELLRADFLRGGAVCVSYGVELESDAGQGLLVAVAGAPEAAAPDTLALLENVLGTLKVGLPPPAKPSTEPVGPTEPVERDATAVSPRAVARFLFLLVLLLGVVLFLIWRRRSRPKVYVSDRLQPRGQERAAHRRQSRSDTWRRWGAFALGSAAAIASAIFAVRVVHRLALWVFAPRAGVAGWLVVDLVLAVVLGTLAWRRWSPTSLVFGATLLLVVIWETLVDVPRTRAAGALYGDQHFAFTRIAATHLTSVLLFFIAAGALYSHPTVRHFLHSRRRG